MDNPPAIRWREFFNNNIWLHHCKIECFDDLKKFLTGLRASTASKIIYNFTNPAITLKNRFDIYALYIHYFINRIARHYMASVVFRILQRDRISSYGYARTPTFVTIAFINAAEEITGEILLELAQHQYLFNTYEDFSADNVVNAILTHRSIISNSAAMRRQRIIARAINIPHGNTNNFNTFLCRRIIELMRPKFIITLLNHIEILTVETITYIIGFITPDIVAKNYHAINLLLYNKLYRHMFNDPCLITFNNVGKVTKTVYLVVTTMILRGFNPNTVLAGIFPSLDMGEPIALTLKDFVDTYHYCDKLWRFFAEFTQDMTMSGDPCTVCAKMSENLHRFGRRVN